MQNQSPKLPPELWARVLSKLPQKDLLTARLVSKDFAPIHRMSGLSLHWHPTSVQGISSLKLFVFRHLQQTTSPVLQVTIEINPQKLTAMTLAYTCARLQQLKIKDRLLQPDSEALLRLLPAGLRSLYLRIPVQLLRDSAWRRLSNLGQLNLLLSSSPGSPASDCAGFNAMTSLQHLTIAFDRLQSRHMSSRAFGTACFSPPPLSTCYSPQIHSKTALTGQSCRA